MLVAAGLLLVGAIVVWFGLRDETPAPARGGSEPAVADGSAAGDGPAPTIAA